MCLLGWAAASISFPAANCSACSQPAAIRAKSCFPASARPRPKYAAHCTPASCASTSNPKANSIRLNRIAGELGKAAPVSLRVNPDVDAKTHPYIATGLKENKFGVAYSDALALYRRARGLPHLRIEGIDCHIGSQLTEIAPFVAALRTVLALVDRLAARRHRDHRISISAAGWASAIRTKHRRRSPTMHGALIDLVGKPLRRNCCSSRAGPLVGNAGILLTRVEYLKHGEEKNFAVVDAAMNDLMRPALYDAWHDVLPVRAGAAGGRTSMKSSARYARAAISSRHDRNWRCGRAICSPSCRPALMA